MKKTKILLSSIVVAVAIIASTSFSFANDASTSEKTVKKEKQVDHVELVAKLEAHMQLMHDQMTLIETTKDKVKRQELMQEHERSMHESMEIMNVLGGNRMLRENREPAYRMTVGEQLDYMWRLMDQMMQHLAAQQTDLEKQ